jgi:DNA-binding MarR family transcriptional regulator
MELITMSENSLEFPVEGRLFLHAYKKVNERIDKDLRSVSRLSATEFEVLWHINRAGGRMRFIQLAHEVKLSQSRVSRQIDSLQTKGYVRREITNENRRATYALMTEEGKIVFQAAEQPFLQAWRTHFLDLISPDDLGVFVHALVALTGGSPLPP